MFGKKSKGRQAQDLPEPKTVQELSEAPLVNPAVKPGKKNSWTYEAAGIAKVWKTATLYKNVAFALGVVAIIEAVAMACLAPMKTVVPYVIEVDKHTGTANIVEFAGKVKLDSDELRDKYWLSQYVLAREGYDYQTVDYEYRKVREMSMPNVFEPFATLFEGERSMDVVMGPEECFRVEILSIQLVGENQAQARFIKRRVKATTVDVVSESYWTATISYSYEPTYTVEEPRLIINPFGFKVTSYRVDQEFTKPGLEFNRSRPVEVPLNPNIPPHMQKRTVIPVTKDTAGLGIPNQP